jgi:predicted Zn-dependent protease
MTLIERFEALLAAGKDDALLRFGLGSEYLKAGDAARAREHLRQAVTQDPRYSAAWKLLGRALAAEGAVEEAMQAYRQGVVAAESRGDKQAAKEMTVFLKRLDRQVKGAVDNDG